MEKGMEYFRHDDTKIRYDGLFKNNLYHGKGKLYNESGICWTGGIQEWNDPKDIVKISETTKKEKRGDGLKMTVNIEF